jgi:hypothetical protein
MSDVFLVAPPVGVEASNACTTSASPIATKGDAATHMTDVIDDHPIDAPNAAARLTPLLIDDDDDTTSFAPFLWRMPRVLTPSDKTTWYSTEEIPPVVYDTLFDPKHPDFFYTEQAALKLDHVQIKYYLRMVTEVFGMGPKSAPIEYAGQTLASTPALRYLTHRVVPYLFTPDHCSKERLTEAHGILNEWLHGPGSINLQTVFFIGCISEECAKSEDGWHHSFTLFEARRDEQSIYYYDVETEATSKLRLRNIRAAKVKAFIQKMWLGDELQLYKKWNWRRVRFVPDITSNMTDCSGWFSLSMLHSRVNHLSKIECKLLPRDTDDVLEKQWCIEPNRAQQPLTPACDLCPGLGQPLTSWLHCQSYIKWVLLSIEAMRSMPEGLPNMEYQQDLTLMRDDIRLDRTVRYPPRELLEIVGHPPRLAAPKPTSAAAAAAAMVDISDVCTSTSTSTSTVINSVDASTIDICVPTTTIDAPKRRGRPKKNNTARAEPVEHEQPSKRKKVAEKWYYRGTAFFNEGHLVRDLDSMDKHKRVPEKFIGPSPPLSEDVLSCTPVSRAGGDLWLVALFINQCLCDKPSLDDNKCKNQGCGGVVFTEYTADLPVIHWMVLSRPASSSGKPWTCHIPFQYEEIRDKIDELFDYAERNYPKRFQQSLGEGQFNPQSQFRGKVVDADRSTITWSESRKFIQDKLAEQDL